MASSSNYNFVSYNEARYCCDPFGSHKKRISKYLRPVQDVIIRKWPALSLSNRKSQIHLSMKMNF